MVSRPDYRDRKQDCPIKTQIPRSFYEFISKDMLELRLFEDLSAVAANFRRILAFNPDCKGKENEEKALSVFFVPNQLKRRRVSGE